MPFPRTPRASASLLVPLLLSLLLWVLAPPTSTAYLPQASTPRFWPEVAGCQLFPVDNIWNTPVDSLPVDRSSAAYVAAIGIDSYAHPDFGSGTWEGRPIGIPFTTVPGAQLRVPLTFQYRDESDPGPYPIPASAPIEGGAASRGDRHVIVVDRDNCVLYELFDGYPLPDGSWTAGSGAIFNLKTNALRPAGWTSADAAGLPILPGLVRYEEVAAGEIRHALRFTAPRTRNGYVWPARHQASRLAGAEYPAMGQRFRLKADFDLAGYAPEVQVILRALQRYGMILADNGSPWFISGVPDERWNNTTLRQLRRLRGADFEAVDVSSLMGHPDWAQARLGSQPGPAIATPSPGARAAPLRFQLGFKALADQIPDRVGEPVDNESWGANGDSVQRTTGGLLVWRRVDNWTAFTNGHRTWVNGPEGLQERGNEERFGWETIRSP